MGTKITFYFTFLYFQSKKKKRLFVKPSRYETKFKIVTLFTLDMIANTAESVISVVSIPRCAKLLARS